jgi:hypothetical protein
MSGDETHCSTDQESMTSDSNQEFQAVLIGHSIEGRISLGRNKGLYGDMDQKLLPS